MNKYFATTAHAVNLIFNGDFSLKVKSGQIPFWTTSKNIIVSPESGTTNHFLEAKGVGADGATNALFSFQRPAAAFDFKVPLAHKQRDSLPAGYHAQSDRHIPAGKYTLSFDTRVVQGRVNLTPVVSVGGIISEIPGTQVVSSKVWKRLYLIIDIPEGVKAVGLAAASTESPTDLHLTRFSFISGAYTVVPYLGDPFKETFPEGAIIMTLGDCPEGFEYLDEGETTPLPEWVAADPLIKGRFGNFVRSGTELTGEVLHNTEDTKTAPGLPGITEFIGPGSLPVVKKEGPYTGAISAAPTVSVDAPSSVGVDTHSHTILPAVSRPTAYAVRLCRRL